MRSSKLANESSDFLVCENLLAKSKTKLSPRQQLRPIFNRQTHSSSSRKRLYPDRLSETPASLTVR